MRGAVADALETVAGPGWRLIPVGGGARDIRSHDCDFVVTHDSNKCGGWGLLLSHCCQVPGCIPLARSPWTVRHR